MARHLARTRNLPHIEIDEIYWKPDWTTVPSEIYERDHEAALALPKWIIDGGGDLASVRKRVDRATDIILLDLPLWVHFWRAAERQFAWANGKLEHPPGGGQEMPPTGRLFEIIWQVDKEWMPILRGLCDDHERQGKSVIRITTLDELDAFSHAG